MRFLSIHPWIKNRRCRMETCAKAAGMAAGIMFLSACGGTQQVSSELSAGIIKSPDFVVPAEISPKSRALYHLFGSSNLSRKVIYYLPVQGYIASIDPGDPESAPDLAASTMQFSTGALAGKTVALIGGGLSVSGSTQHLKNLMREARSAGYEVAPAPAKAVRTSLSLVSKEDVSENNFDAFLVPPIALRVWNPKFQSHGPVGIVNFQAVIHPEFSPRVVDALRQGDSLRNLIAFQVDWQLTDEKLTHKAIINVDYNKMHTFISSRIGAKFMFAQVEVKDLFEKMITCQNIDKCGVSVEWFDEYGAPTEQPSPNQGLVNAVVAAQKELQDRLFQKITEFKNELGVAGSEPMKEETFFSYSKNTARYEQHIRDRREIYYNPGAETFEVSTALVMQCVHGQVNKPMEWDRSSPHCRKVFGFR